MLIELYGKKMVSNKRLVFVLEYLGKDTNSTSYYWTKILEFLGTDYEILIIAPNSKKNISYLNSSNFKSILYELTSYSKANLFSRLRAYIKMSLAFYKVSKHEFTGSDILISGTNSIFNMFFLSLIKKKLDTHWLLFGYDIFPENLIPANVVSKYNPIFKIASVIFSRLYSSPDDIVAVGRDMRTLLIKKVNNRTRVHYIPNWAQHSEIELSNKNDNSILNQLNWNMTETIVFQFFGNFGVLQDVYGVLEAIKLAKAPNAKFLFIGSGSEAGNISALIEKIGDERIYFYGECDISAKNTALNACDVAFVPLIKGMLGLAVPSKSYFSFAANKPIIAIGDEGSELRLLVDEYPLGWGCNSGDPVVLAKIIDDISSNKGSLAKMEPRASLINHFSETHSLTAIRNLISDY